MHLRCLISSCQCAHLEVPVDDIPGVKVLDHFKQLIENILFMNILQYSGFNGCMQVSICYGTHNTMI